VARGDRLDDPALLSRKGQFPRRPVGHGQPQLLGVFTRQGDELRQLCGRELPRSAAPVLVGQHVEDGGLQLFVGGLGSLGRGQLLAGRSPPVSPASDSLRVDGQQESLRHGRLALGAPEHDLDALCQPPFDGP